MDLLAAIAILVLLGGIYIWVSNLRRRIVNPRLAFLDFTEGASDDLIAEDKEAVADLFTIVQVSRLEVRPCDVLFIYTTLGDGGVLQDGEHYLRATIRDAGAKVVVVASENSAPPPGGGPAGYGHANLVITLSRNGASFPRFFRELFSRMKAGTPMPVAWNRLAPQIPGRDHEDCPSAIFLCEVGGISFR